MSHIRPLISARLVGLLFTCSAGYDKYGHTLFMRVSAHFTTSKDAVTFLVTVDAARATRVQNAAGLQQTAALT